MSGIPREIPDIGSTGARLRQNPAFDPMRAGITTEDYFVWSRFDGVTSLHDLILMTGFATDRAIDIVRRLRALGALLLPGETTVEPAAAPPRRAAAGRRDHDTSSPPAPDRGDDVGAGARRAPTRPSEAPTLPRPAPLSELPDPTAEELLALAEPCDLAADERVGILAVIRRIASGDAHDILGVAHDADAREIKRAYFRLSKELHPDRHYGRQLGSFAARLAMTFQAIAEAYEDLVEGGTRRRIATSSEPPQTPQEYAADLFARACTIEVQGDPAGALRLFDAAIRVDGQARYLRRAASCALAARQLRVAEEYAKKAASLDSTDPSTARLLAQVFRVAGKLALAEEVLVMAMALKNENDVLGAELRSDLSEVRRLLSGANR